MLKTSYLSTQFVDPSTPNYAYGKINAVIIDDVDKNGFRDIITFPSAFSVSQSFAPVVWANANGSFAHNNKIISGAMPFQFFRDSVPGDFNGDGFRDYIQLDQGWELNDRNPLYFYGNQPAMLQGTRDGLKWVNPTEWMDPRALAKKTFNHIGDAADYDGDGDLDVAIAAFWDYRLYKNDGSGKFTWEESAIPVTSRDASGTTFIKLCSQYAIVNGFYRAWDAHTVTKPLQVLTQSNGVFVESYTLARPDLGGKERNFGAADMYNQDVNGDGREDLVVTWETEPQNGINDGLSNMTGVPQTPRYKDVSNTIVNVYLQDKNGRLVNDTPSKIYNLDSWTSGAQIYFDDINRDGHQDFWATSFGTHPKDFYKLVFLNDGRGNFANPSPEFFKLSETFPDWYLVSPYFVDIDNDGDFDVAAQRGVFGQDYYNRNIGEELRIFVNDATNISPHSRQVIDQAYQLYRTIFNREPDLEGARYWISRINDGAALVDVANAFVSSGEFVSTYGTGRNEDLLTRCYQNVLGRDPDAGGYAWWLSQMQQNAQIYSKGNVVATFMKIADDLDIVGVSPANYADYL